ncbi:MAG: hypothetical protein QOE11_1373 [Solirubrobacteraceae bacterium]|jgi:plastocyanin|nr:hypothetical protein [Solirubrobacteraceae bacterium]
MQRLLDDRRVLLPVLLTAVAIALGSVLIVALGASASNGPSSASSAAASAPPGHGRALTIDITNFKYRPAAVTVRAGSRVSWVNNDAAPHTATASGAFDTGTLKKGERRTLTLAKAGTYAYICQFHPFMKATVTVR